MAIGFELLRFDDCRLGSAAFARRFAWDGARTQLPPILWEAFWAQFVGLFFVWANFVWVNLNTLGHFFEVLFGKIFGANLLEGPIFGDGRQLLGDILT